MTECRKCGKFTKNPTYCSKACTFAKRYDGTKKYCRGCGNWKPWKLVYCDDRQCNGRRLATRPNCTTNKDPDRWNKAYAV